MKYIIVIEAIFIFILIYKYIILKSKKATHLWENEVRSRKEKLINEELYNRSLNINNFRSSIILKLVITIVDLAKRSSLSEKLKYKFIENINNQILKLQEEKENVINIILEGAVTGNNLDYNMSRLRRLIEEIGDLETREIFNHIVAEIMLKESNEKLKNYDVSS